MTWRSAVAVLPFLVVLPLTACAAVPAGAPSAPASRHGAPTVPRSELLRRQARLDVVAGEITALVDPTEGPISTPLPSGDDRFGEVRLDLERDWVEVSWAGPLPAEVLRIIRRHPEVDVVVRTVRYSNDELQRAGDRVEVRLRSGALGKDVTADMIEHDVRAGRIVVHVVDPHACWTRAALLPELESVAGVPMDLELTRTSIISPT